MMISSGARSVVGGIFLAVVAIQAAPGWAPAQERKAPVPSPLPLTIGNEQGKLVRLSARDRERLPRHTVEVKEREVTARYEGVLLADVLRFAGVPLGGHLRGPRVAEYVLVEAGDGYRAVFALAEVDPGVTDKVVLLADRREGQPLPEGVGPYRLVVPGDKIHSRWVRQVTRITVQRPPPSQGGTAPKR